MPDVLGYKKIVLTGGGTSALDGIDGDDLNDGDFAFVLTTANDLYVYLLDADSAAAESSPNVIAPDVNAGDKRWVLCSTRAASYQGGDDFDQEAAAVQFESGLNADFWTTAGTNYAAANVTFVAGAGGNLQAVTAGSDDDSVTILGLALIEIDKNPWVEARFKIVAAYAYIAVGFVEGSYADKASPDDDIAVVGIDTDNGHGFGAAQLCLFTNDNAGGLVTDDTGLAMSYDTFVTIRIDLTDTEQPRVWINSAEIAAGSITGTVQAGITVMPYIMVQSLSNAADTFTIDYIRWGQDR